MKFQQYVLDGFRLLSTKHTAILENTTKLQEQSEYRKTNGFSKTTDTYY